MGLQLYKPNKNKTGAACTWSFNSKVDQNKAVYLDLVKQTGWDEKNRTGSFKDGDKIKIKFDFKKEVGGLLRILSNQSRPSAENKIETSFYHTSDWGVNKIKFSKVDFKGRILYGLSVQSTEKGKEEIEFKIAFDEDEAFTLKNWLTFAQNHIFNGIYSEDKKKVSDKKAD